MDGERALLRRLPSLVVEDDGEDRSPCWRQAMWQAAGSLKRYEPSPRAVMTVRDGAPSFSPSAVGKLRAAAARVRLAEEAPRPIEGEVAAVGRVFVDDHRRVVDQVSEGMASPRQSRAATTRAAPRPPWSHRARRSQCADSPSSGRHPIRIGYASADSPRSLSRRGYACAITSGPLHSAHVFRQRAKIMSLTHVPGKAARPGPAGAIAVASSWTRGPSSPCSPRPSGAACG